MNIRPTHLPAAIAAAALALIGSVAQATEFR
jgi:hypothetical protein